jgi:hypothetical protein
VIAIDTDTIIYPDVIKDDPLGRTVFSEAVIAYRQYMTALEGPPWKRDDTGRRQRRTRHLHDFRCYQGVLADTFAIREGGAATNRSAWEELIAREERRLGAQ